tara:strand:- start:10426 stop:12348 length:1923 start_codon:yes stop_codon:yes gene_type:complete
MCLIHSCARVKSPGVFLEGNDLVNVVKATAYHLEQKISLIKGLRVGLLLENTIEFLICYLAIIELAGVVLPLNPNFTGNEIVRNLCEMGADAIVLLEKFSERLKNPIKTLNLVSYCISYDIIDTTKTVKESNIKKENLCMILLTSGTTIRPRKVPLSLGNIVSSLENISCCYNLCNEDTTLLMMPLFNVHGLICGMLSSLFSGSETVLPRLGNFDAATFWLEVDDNSLNWFSCVPTMHAMLSFRHKDDCPVAYEEFPPFRFIRSCSAPLPQSLYESMYNLYNEPIIEAYGMTEASHQITSNPLNGKQKVNSVGLPTGVELKILRENGEKINEIISGEICIRGDSIMYGYEDEESNNALISGWFCTGDQGYVDEEGYVFLTSRIKESINKGGHKINPVEIETILLKCKYIKECVAFAGENDLFGEDVNCAIVLHEGENCHEFDIIEFIRGNVAEFKLPSKIYITDTIPRTIGGNIKRRRIAEYFSNFINYSIKPVEYSVYNNNPLTKNKIYNNNLVFNTVDKLFKFGGNLDMSQSLITDLGLQSEKLSILTQELQKYVNITVVDLYRFNTIGELSRYISKNVSIIPIENKLPEVVTKVPSFWDKYRNLFYNFGCIGVQIIKFKFKFKFKLKFIRWINSNWV